MKPAVKVLLVVIIVLVVVHILKYWMAGKQEETYIPWIHQEFETVPPQPFVVTPSTLTINSDVTAIPVLTQVATDVPAVAPTMVPTFVPTTVPAMVATDRPTMIPTLVPTMAPAMVTVRPDAPLA